jgi:uncharacterized protein YfaS (alpha-2-macroglobulin family)
LKEPQRVQIELEADPCFELLDSRGPRRTLELGPAEVTHVNYRIRAKKVGRFPLVVRAGGEKMTDAVRRFVEVRPDGFPVEQVVGGPLRGTATHTVVFPDAAIAGASRLAVRIAPSALSQVLDGIEGLLRQPHGCFEQTSATTYPNVLVLDYLRKTPAAAPEVLQRAEQYLRLGYQRLLTFERPGGGFDWFGRDRPVLWLTALGLHEFTDMARVFPVDEKVLARTRSWLLRQQAADGSWTDGDPARRLLVTSYVAWAFLEGGERCPEVEKAVGYIREHCRQAQGTYEQALGANALAAWDPQDRVVRDLLGQLERQQVVLDEGKACCFPSTGQSLSHAWGDSLTVETTALAALAFAQCNLFPATTTRALAYLAGVRTSGGTWGSTQATVLALKALMRAGGRARCKDAVTFALRMHGKKVQQGQVTEANADVVQEFDLTAHLRPGRNEVALQVAGDAAMTYQVVARYFQPWKDRPAAEPTLELSMNYDRTRLSTRDRLRATATLKYHGRRPTAMVMLELGVPPGFDVDRSDLATLVAMTKVQKVNRTTDRLTLYLGDVAANSSQSFAYTLRPKYPVKAKAPVAVAYEYYTPANRGAAAPVELTVEEAGK